MSYSPKGVVVPTACAQALKALEKELELQDQAKLEKAGSKAEKEERQRQEILEKKLKQQQKTVEQQQQRAQRFSARGLTKPLGFMNNLEVNNNNKSRSYSTKPAGSEELTKTVRVKSILKKQGSPQKPHRLATSSPRSGQGRIVRFASESLAPAAVSVPSNKAEVLNSTEAPLPFQQQSQEESVGPETKASTLAKRLRVDQSSPWLTPGGGTICEHAAAPPCVELGAKSSHTDRTLSADSIGPHHKLSPVSPQSSLECKGEKAQQVSLPLPADAYQADLKDLVEIDLQQHQFNFNEHNQL